MESGLHIARFIRSRGFWIGAHRIRRGEQVAGILSDVKSAYLDGWTVAQYLGEPNVFMPLWLYPVWVTGGFVGGVRDMTSSRRRRNHES
jgi:hypothetical protein